MQSVIPGNPSRCSTNGWYSSGNVYTSRAAASEAASQHQTKLAGGVWKKHLFGTGSLTFVYEDGEGFGYSLVPYHGGMAPAFGASSAINVTARGLAPVTARHTAGGARIAGKRVCNAGEDVATRVQTAGGAPRVPTAGGKFASEGPAGGMNY